MIHHPHEDILEQFAKGVLNAPLAVMTSAHLEKCDECQKKYEGFLNEVSEELRPYQLVEDEIENVFDSVMEKVGELPQRKVIERNNLINILGKEIELPKSMKFIDQDAIKWKQFGKNNAISTLTKSKEGSFYLIYMGEGEGVPLHDHSSLEYSYIINGSFNDGITTFSTGDFSVLGKDYTHSPNTTSEGGCLVISWVEGRLNFFRGPLRPLNSIFWWLFNK